MKKGSLSDSKVAVLVEHFFFPVKLLRKKKRLWKAEQYQYPATVSHDAKWSFVLYLVSGMGMTDKSYIFPELCTEAAALTAVITWDVGSWFFFWEEFQC